MPDAIDRFIERAGLQGDAGAEFASRYDRDRLHRPPGTKAASAETPEQDDEVADEEADAEADAAE